MSNIEMIYSDRIGATEGIIVNKTSISKNQKSVVFNILGIS